jgi:O-acetyl-ADP-ribose deacetylase (regulator of RNase III)
MVIITEIRGNIFASSCQIIVIPVNCVGVMGKGIALEFKKRYPEMFAAYARLCANRCLRPGLLHLWTQSTPWILNFPTKDHWKHPARIAYIRKGLEKFSDTYAAKGTSSIAFPELGTGAGGLAWVDVQPVMYRFIEPLPHLEVEIYHYDAMTNVEAGDLAPGIGASKHRKRRDEQQ